MKSFSFLKFLPLIFLFGFITSCKQSSKKSDKEIFQYSSFKDSIMKYRDSLYDSSNFFDDSTSAFYPNMDSSGNFFNSLDTLLSQLKRQDSLSADEKLVLEENLAMLDSFYKTKEDTAAGGCKENECSLYAHVIKSRQIMHLYINGEMKDSFEISTGLEKYATPEMSIRPRGPVFKKYTSKKFPGGNYKGLGNMPYVVFIKGGYAIHGTTQGNLKKLGQTASHGCIRLHPDNARLFYELVKVFGLKKTWVKVEE